MSNSKTIEVSVETIDTTTAEKYLAEGGVNYRKLREGYVERLARDMAAGRWLLTGDAIRFDTKGDLVDGQHRLRAVMNSGVPLTTLVVRGVSTETVDRMDLGLKRSVGDVLRHHGVARFNIIAAILAKHWQWKAGLIRSQSARATASEMLALYQSNTDLYDRASAVASRVYQKGMRVSQGTLGLAYLLFEQVDSGEAAEFFALLESGENLDRRSPIYALRRLIQRHMVEPNYRLRDPGLIAYLVKAWNFWRDGVQVEYLQWTGQQQVPEPR